LQRLGHIDALRGLAAIAVIYFHVAENAMKNARVHAEWEGAIFTVFTQYMDLGKIGVIVFFAISGFVIPFSLLHKRRQPVRAFVISRFFRLYPAYWISVFCAVFCLYFFAQKLTPPHIAFANITMLQQFLGIPNLLGLYWTLQIELIFYALCLLVFLLNWLERPKAVAAFALFMIFASLAMAVARFYMERKLPVALPMALSVMFWGFIYRFSYIERKEEWKRQFRLVSFWLLISIPITCFLAYNRDFGNQETWYRYAITYYAAIAIFFFSQNPRRSIALPRAIWAQSVIRCIYSGQSLNTSFWDTRRSGCMLCRHISS
jgi:peptidoglycan/LPS O-acetylase OafA/YrhL